MYSITNYSELENAKSVLRQNTLSPANKKQNYFKKLISNERPIIFTLLCKSILQLISSHINNKFLIIILDGFEKVFLKKVEVFEIDNKHIVVSSLYTLYEDNKIPLQTLEKALVNIISTITRIILGKYSPQFFMELPVVNHKDYEAN